MPPCGTITDTWLTLRCVYEAASAVRLISSFMVWCTAVERCGRSNTHDARFDQCATAGAPSLTTRRRAGEVQARAHDRAVLTWVRDGGVCGTFARASQPARLLAGCRPAHAQLPAASTASCSCPAKARLGGRLGGGIVSGRTGSAHGLRRWVDKERRNNWQDGHCSLQSPRANSAGRAGSKQKGAGGVPSRRLNHVAVSYRIACVAGLLCRAK